MIQVDGVRSMMRGRKIFDSSTARYLMTCNLQVENSEVNLGFLMRDVERESFFSRRDWRR